MQPVDFKRIAAEVSAQHGIRVDADDPIMAVVTLNRLVLEQSVAEVMVELQSSIQRFDAAIDKVQVRAGGLLAQEVRDCSAALQEEVAKTLDKVGGPVRSARFFTQAAAIPAWKWIAVSLVAGWAQFVTGVWIGTHVQWPVRF